MVTERNVRYTRDPRNRRGDIVAKLQVLCSWASMWDGEIGHKPVNMDNNVPFAPIHGITETVKCVSHNLFCYILCD